MTKNILVLFDIDGTLFFGGGSGRDAFTDAGVDIVGVHYQDHHIEFAGRLDTWIATELLRHNNVTATPQILERLRSRHTYHLKRRLYSGEHKIYDCPGALNLVKKLVELQDAPHATTNGYDITLGLLTGNWTPNGMLKVESVGFDPAWFTVNAWGCDAGTRNELPPIARQRYLDQRMHSTGEVTSLSYTDMVIVGDTQHDIECAKVHGCRSLAVAMGWTTLEDLKAEEPDLALADLTETDRIIEWLLSD